MKKVIFKKMENNRCVMKSQSYDVIDFDTANNRICLKRIDAERLFSEIPWVLDKDEIDSEGYTNITWVGLYSNIVIGEPKPANVFLIKRELRGKVKLFTCKKVIDYDIVNNSITMDDNDFNNLNRNKSLFSFEELEMQNGDRLVTFNNFFIHEEPLQRIVFMEKHNGKMIRIWRCFIRRIDKNGIRISNSEIDCLFKHTKYGSRIRDEFMPQQLIPNTLDSYLNLKSNSNIRFYVY